MEEKKVYSEGSDKNVKEKKKYPFIVEFFRNMPPEERRKKVLFFTGFVFFVVLLLGFIFK